MTAQQRPQPGSVADQLMKAVWNKMLENLDDLEKAKHGTIRWRKDKGKVEIEFTPTK